MVQAIRRRFNAPCFAAALALSIAGVFALHAGIARAETPGLILYGNFAAQSPFGVAVDNSDLEFSGDVYVAALDSSNINKFDAAGKSISPPSPFGEGSGFYSGTAVNPTNGDVYVVDARGQAIDTYDPRSGALLSSFAVSGCANGLSGNYIWTQIATDSAGNVYLACGPKNEVEVFSSSGGAPSGVAAAIGGSGANALSGPTGVAVDSSGNVWVADGGDNRVEEFSSSGAFIGEIKSEGVRTLAVNTHGDVFALVHNGADFCGAYEPPCYHVVKYSPAGVQLADIGAGAIGAAAPFEFYGVTDMLAINESNGQVYVTDGANDLIWIYGPPSPPAVDKELTAEVSTSEAKLGALVNPGGLETSYRFEYGTTSEYGHTTPFPEGNAGQGVSARTVWASASGLAPGTTYHYRVIVTSALGKVVGADQTFTTETAAETICPNEQFRDGFSGSLPDCRAYELVTTPNENSTQPDTAFFGPAGNAAREGNRMSYGATEAPPGTQSGGLEYMATRGASGWSSEGVIPLQSYGADRCPLDEAGMQAYSADLSEGVLFDSGQERLPGTGDALGKGTCGAEAVEVVSGEPLGSENLLLRDNAAGTYQLINLTPPGVTPANARFDGASSDLSHIIFDEQAPLVAGAPAGVDDLYEWSGGVVRLVSVLPDGTPVVGSLAATPFQPLHSYSVSADGSHVFFTAQGGLYVRIDGTSTVQVDASQGGSGSSGGGEFMDASADGSKVFFMDDSRLTSDSTAESGEPDLYECEFSEGGDGCALTDLTVAGASAHADVQGVVGISEDGDYVYFVADGVLSGSQTNERDETAQSGQPNLYLFHSGVTTFIATLAPSDNCVEETCARVSPNGLFFAFVSYKSLAGYDNKDANTGEADQEIYLYDAGSNRLACASCNPSGEAPTGGATMHTGMGQAPHYLSDGGRLFFDTTEALLPSDTDGQADVYEYENGQLHLISTGTSSTASELLDASENGDDVFILTRQKLLPRDTNEEALSIYDARVDGGFPEVASPPSCTTADACRNPVSPQPAIFGAPSSQTFSGAGNLAPPFEAKPQKKTKRSKAKRSKGKTCKGDKRTRARCTARTRGAVKNAKPQKGGK